MTNHEKFAAVCQRLLQATSAPTEAALAEMLGFKPNAFSNRKKRAALPTEEIDELIRLEGLRSEWVYDGELPMYAAGERTDRLEQELKEVIEQIRASAVHNETLETLRPLLKGIIWQDEQAIEQWLENMGKMTQIERQVLTAFRNGGPDVQAAMLLIARTGARDKPGNTLNFHGAVGQTVVGDLHTGSQVLYAHEPKPVRRASKKGSKA